MNSFPTSMNELAELLPKEVCHLFNQTYCWAPNFVNLLATFASLRSQSWPWLYVFLLFRFLLWSLIGVSNEHKEGHLLARENDHVCNPRHCNFGLYSVVLVAYWMDVFGHRYYGSKYSSTMTFRSDWSDQNFQISQLTEILIIDSHFIANSNVTKITRNQVCTIKHNTFELDPSSQNFAHCMSLISLVMCYSYQSKKFYCYANTEDLQKKFLFSWTGNHL